MDGETGSDFLVGGGSGGGGKEDAAPAAAPAPITPEVVPDPLIEARKGWEATPGTMPYGFRGVACKCGAHISSLWENGGKEWFEQHVANEHAGSFDWKAAVRHALSLAAEEGAAYLAKLVGL